MSKTAFAQTIISKLKASINTDGTVYDNGSAPTAMSAVAQGITEYLIANTVVTVAYSGMIPGTPPFPDPIAGDTFSIVGACAPPKPSDGFDSWMQEIESNIIAGFQLAPMGNMGLVFAQVPFLNIGVLTRQTNLTETHEVRDEDCQIKCWEVVCEGIMNWINTTALNPTPGPASRPSSGSTGTAYITNITIS